MLIYSGYSLGHPQLCLIRAREAKITKSDWVASSIRDISVGIAFVWGVSIRVVIVEGVFA